MDTPRRIATYCKLLFSSFFKWWWAVISGIITLMGFLAIPKTGITLSPIAVGVCLLALLSLGFLVLTTVYQGWLLFDQQLASTKFLSVCNNDDYADGLVFLLKSPMPVSNGLLFEVRRAYKGAEVLIGVVETRESTTTGQLQAESVWMAPGHQRDLRLGKVQANDIFVSPKLHRRTLSRIAEAQVLGGEANG